MKKFKSIFLLIAGILFMLQIGRKIAYDNFQLGLSAATENYVTCRQDDDSKQVFPKYFQTCNSLCNSLYKDKVMCVSSINGGSVTCVCAQTESK